jgi:hypothetical protein
MTEQVGLCPSCLKRMSVEGHALVCGCGKRIPLLGLPVVPVGEHETSANAAHFQSKTGRAATDEARVLDFIRARGGATDFEIEEGLSLIHQTASARRRGLVTKGLVVETAGRRKSPRGRESIVWRVR